jgi:hypothetical protein
MDVAVVVAKCRERAAKFTQPGSLREILTTEFLEAIADVFENPGRHTENAVHLRAEINGRKESERWRQRQVG